MNTCGVEEFDQPPEEKVPYRIFNMRNFERKTR